MRRICGPNPARRKCEEGLNAIEVALCMLPVLPKRLTCLTRRLHRENGMRHKQGIRRAFTWAIFALLCTRCPAAIYYADCVNGNSGYGGTSWATAKATISAAIALANNGDSVLVAEGTYAPSSEIVVSKAIVVKGVKGADSTVVDGSNIRRGFNISHANAVVDGFTITRGKAPAAGTTYVRTASGGGVYLADGTMQNCVITGNLAGDGDRYVRYPRGGGVYILAGTLRNCVVANNLARSATMDGGGWGGGIWARNCSIENCRITGNSLQISNYESWGAGIYAAVDVKIINSTVVSNTCTSGMNRRGGGIYMAGGSAAHNCILWDNSASSGANWYIADADSVMSYCDTSPLPVGTGNISLNPLFSDAALRLQSNSPCIAAGSVLHRTACDLDGRDRDPFAPDMGCYQQTANANMVTVGYPGITSPQITILSVSNRFRSNIVDIQYRLTDPDSSAVEVRGYAIAATDHGPEWSYVDDLYPLATMVDGTSSNYGENVTPTGAVKLLAWDAGVDIGNSISNIRIELLANDCTNLPVSMNFLTIPADTNGPAFEINVYSGASSDYQLRRSLVWALCKGIVTKDGVVLSAVGGTYAGQTIADGGLLTPIGRQWLCENIGNARVATPQESQRAREASTPGTVTKWPSYYQRGKTVNEFALETTDDDGWYIVSE